MRIVSRSNNEKIHRAVFYLARTEDRELVVHAHPPRSFLSRWKVDDKKDALLRPRDGFVRSNNCYRYETLLRVLSLFSSTRQ